MFGAEQISLVITVVVGIFTAGVTWGIMSAKQRALTTRIDATINELKNVVAELRAMASEVKVNSAISARVEDQLAIHNEEISLLKEHVAKLQARIS